MKKESLGGQKLLCVGNFHLGTFVQKFLRLRMNQLTTYKTVNFVKQCVYYSTLDGAVGYIAPISKNLFKKLGKLEMRLSSVINHVAGLNPKAFRLYRPAWRMQHNHHRSVIDGELLWKFVHLPNSQQDVLAKQSGLTTEQVLDSIFDIYYQTMFA